MGGIGGFLFGKPSKSKETSSSSSGNYAYNGLAQTLGPASNYVTSSGNMIASLLGLPGYGGNPAPAGTPVPAPATNPFPPVGGAAGGHTGSANTGVFRQIFSRLRPNQGIEDGGGGYQTNPVSSVTPATTPPAGTGTPATPGASPQSSALQSFSDSAGMKFLEDEGNRMINSNQAAKGMLSSGSTLHSLQNYAHGLSTTYLDKFLQNLFSLGQMGNTSSGILASAGAHSSGTGSGSSSGAKTGLIPMLIQGAASAAVAA